MTDMMDFDKYIVLDFETTGLSRGYRPVEIAWVEFDPDFTVKESVSQLINPQIPIEPGATKVHGLTDADVAEMPTLDHFMFNMRGGEFMGSNVLVVAHNAKFDFPMFKPYCRDAKSLCTLILGLAIYPKVKSHRLHSLAQMCGIEQVPTHRALADVETCFALLRHYAEHRSMNLEQLMQSSTSFNGDSIVPFGKYQGIAVKNLPPHYKRWALETLEKDHWMVKVLNDLLNSHR